MRFSTSALSFALAQPCPQPSQPGLNEIIVVRIPERRIFVVDITEDPSASPEDAPRRINHVPMISYACWASNIPVVRIRSGPNSRFRVLLPSSPPAHLHPIMLRSAIAAQLRHSAVPRSRSFVSTVLLTKAWENETVNELRREARKRGLPAGGSKATLITRLQQDDKKRTLSQEPVSTAPQTQVRHASTVETPTEVPGVPSSGTEPAYPKFTLDVKLPDISEPEPEPPTPIPLVPDLWESSKIKKEAAPPQPDNVPKPKVITVAGAATHPGGGPSHNLYSPTASVSSANGANANEPKSTLGQLAADMAEDLGLPTSFARAPPAESQYDVAQKTETSGGQDKSYSRTLDKDERVGVWIIVGLFASSWVAAGYFAPTSAWAHQVEVKVEDVAEKTAGKKH
ncbi:hypothetical protein BN946_scf184785.g26 [Trametes cinnabarina]|uniref:SAP domain-containing protein n=1 Tax=Pycnoporus cinnabarinus TaxID=5643 RepID=A0A060S5P5_PYCCI|nr:hypothetical protein BN946_scf184785.g26 [Trametes cinnabarina]